MANDEDMPASGQEANLDQHIEHLEEKIAGLRPAAFSDEPSPAKGMAMLRKAKAKNDLATAKNKPRAEV